MLTRGEHQHCIVRNCCLTLPSLAHTAILPLSLTATDCCLFCVLVLLHALCMDDCTDWCQAAVEPDIFFDSFLQLLNRAVCILRTWKPIVCGASFLVRSMGSLALQCFACALHASRSGGALYTRIIPSQTPYLITPCHDHHLQYTCQPARC